MPPPEARSGLRTPQAQRRLVKAVELRETGRSWKIEPWKHTSGKVKR